MRIGLQTWGSDGDIRPFIALASGLRAAGHEVTLAVTSIDGKDYSALAEASDFEIIHVCKIDSKSSEYEQLVIEMFHERNIIKQFFLLVNNFYNPYVEEMFEAARVLADKCDILIPHFMLYPTASAADMRGMPYIPVYLNHIIKSRYAPIPGLPNLGQLCNGLLWWVGGKVMSHMFGTSVDLHRRDLGLEPFGDILNFLSTPKHMSLIAVSPSICRRQPDWSDKFHISGFLNVPESVEPWVMPKDLMEFMKSGPPPVYMTFGSMMSVNRTAVEDSTRLMVEAARLSGQRAIVQSRWDELSGLPHSDDIFRIKHAPHKYIFPSCSAVVHHCGAGSTQSATLAGCPSIPVPHVLDQFLWADELYRLGVAPKSLERRHVTAKQLAGAIDITSTSSLMKHAAQQLSKQMSAEDGVAEAVRLIEQIGD